MLGEHGRDDLATTGDLALMRDDLKGEMSELRTELRSEMSELRTELRSEMSELRVELKGEMSEVRSDVAAMRQEMDLKFATKDDLLALRDGFDTAFHSYVRTFIATQAATVVGVTGIVYALTRLT